MGDGTALPGQGRKASQRKHPGVQGWKDENTSKDVKATLGNLKANTSPISQGLALPPKPLVAFGIRSYVLGLGL